MTSRELCFKASLNSLRSGRLATFYIIDTTLNRNGWRVTDEALERALPTLLGKPLGCVPGYGVNHVAEPQIVGYFITAEKPDGYLLATAEITDPTAWEKLQSGEWGPVSVVIKAHKVRCSLCGADVTSGPDEHILNGEGHQVVEDFTFERVDFVSNPAYPSARLITLRAAVVPYEETPKAPMDYPWDADEAERRIRLWAGGPEKEDIDWSRYRRAFAWYDASNPENFGSYKLPHHDVIDGRLHVVWRGVVAAMQSLLGARGGVDIPEADRRAVYEHLARHYREFGREPPEFRASWSTDVDGDSGPRGSAPKPEGEEVVEMEVEELRAQLESLRRRVERVERILEASQRPKARLGEVDEVRSAMEEARLRLFGYRRDI